MDDTKVFLNKLIRQTNSCEDEEVKHIIYIESKWENDSIELHLHTSDQNKTYKGELSSEKMQNIAGELGMPFNDFYAECKEALTADLKLEPFVYTLNYDEPMFRLTKEGNPKIEYIDIPLKALSNNSSLLDTAIAIIQNLREHKPLKKIVETDTVSEEVMEELRKCVVEKKNLEKKLMRKFMMLLNSKKRKITELKKHYEYEEESEENVDENENEPCDDDDFNAETQVLTTDITMET